MDPWALNLDSEGHLRTYILLAHLCTFEKACSHELERLSAFKLATKLREYYKIIEELQGSEEIHVSY